MSVKSIHMKHTTLLLALATMFAIQSQAQCRNFTKKNCLPALDGYVQNDNYNSAVLIPGDEAELELTFWETPITASLSVLTRFSGPLNSTCSTRTTFVSGAIQKAQIIWTFAWKMHNDFVFESRSQRLKPPSCMKAASPSLLEAKIDPSLLTTCRKKARFSRAFFMCQASGISESPNAKCGVLGQPHSIG